MIIIAFVILDVIVASILQFLGLMFLPPQMISLPVKILIFLMVGGFDKIVDILFHSIKT
jgi:flagellar biosynthetic protein FliP